MADKPNQNRSALESKEKTELLEIAKAAGIKTSGRASKDHLIELIAGGAAPSKTERAEKAASPTVRRGGRTVEVR